MKFKAYTGRSLEELAPQIRDELGPDAVILSTRESVSGGVGGFFGTKAVEVLAADRIPDGPVDAASAEADPVRAPEARIDRKADTDALAELVNEVLSGPGIQRAALAAVETPSAGDAPGATMPASAAAAAYAPAGPPRAPRIFPAPLADLDGPDLHVVPDAPRAYAAPQSSAACAAVIAELVGAGVADAVARSLVEATNTHVVPLAPERSLRDLVRERIAAEARCAIGWSGVEAGPHTLAAVGPSGSGKTTVLVALAERYVAAGRTVGMLVIEHPQQGGRSTISSRIRGAIWGGGEVEVHRVRTLAEVRAARKALSHLELVLIDTPGLGAGDGAGAERLAKLLSAAGASEVHAVLPVAMEERERDAVLTRLVAAGASRVVVTRLDEARRVGAVVDVTQRFDLELSYLGCGPCIPDDLRAADGAYIAARVLPMD